MADVASSHGGDNGGDPPHGSGRRLEAPCENGGKKPLPVTFDDKKEMTVKAIGENQELFTRFIGNQVRLHILPKYRNWKKVPPELKARVNKSVHDYFDIYGHVAPEMHGLVDIGVDKEASERFKDWKSSDSKIGCWCVKTMFGYARDPETGEWSSIMDNWKKIHTKNGNWVNEEAASDYEAMVEVRESQLELEAVDDTPVNEHDMVKVVLGDHRGFTPGVGRKIRGISRSSGLNTYVYQSSERIARLEETVVSQGAIIQSQGAVIQEMKELIASLVSGRSRETGSSREGDHDDSFGGP